MKNGLKSFWATSLSTAATFFGQMTDSVRQFRTPVWIRMKQIKYFEFLAILLGLPTIIMIWIDLDDRQAERSFRAWEVVQSVPETIREDPLAYLSSRSTRRTTFETGSSLRQAVEFLNREFSGFGCLWGVPWTSRVLTGSLDRECIVPRKRREILDGLIAVGVDFSQVNLRHARLSRSFWNRSVLSDADLSHAEIVGANFMEADLRRANLTDARVNGSILIGADLSDAALERTSFRGADLAAARVSRLTNADLSDATLMFTNLSQASVVSSEFTDAVFFGTDVSGAILDDVEFSGANLWLSDFSGVDMSRTNSLTQAQLDSVCIDPRSAVRLPANAGLTTVKAELYFDTCRALTADPHRKYALFELLFKLSHDASGDPFGWLDRDKWGYERTPQMWLTLLSPDVSDVVGRLNTSNSDGKLWDVGKPLV